MVRQVQLPSKAARAGNAPSISVVNHEVGRQLSERVAEESRLAFARSFSRAVVEACWRNRCVRSLPPPLPPNVELIALTDHAANEAERLGAALAEHEPCELAYLVGTAYTAALPPPYRISQGIYYTPPALVERLLVLAERAGVNWRAGRVLDPSCGGGAFLIRVANRMIGALAGTDAAFILQQIGTRLRGFDLDPFGAWLAQAMLTLTLDDLTHAAGRRLPDIIETRDSLDLRPGDLNTYDLVIGNPPYGRVTLPAERRAVFARSVYGHANLYGLFTDAALRWVKDGGVVGYVTPTSMVSGLYFKALRSLLAAEAPPAAINFITAREGVFNDALQETMLATYRRGGLGRGGNVGFINFERHGRARCREAGLISLPSRPQAPWLLPRSPQQASLTRRLGGMGYRLSHYGYGVSTGPLVWNRHKAQFRTGPASGSHPVIWAESVTADGRFEWRSERRNHAPWFAADLPKDKWLIVDRPCVLIQRTTAKEQARRLIAAELPGTFIRRNKGVAIENHLNMVRAVVPKPMVPLAAIAALLNSAAVDEAFRCINGSVAVSAFELEELPLPSPTVMRRLAKLIAANAPPAKIEAVIAGAYQRADAAAAA